GQVIPFLRQVAAADRQVLLRSDLAAALVASQGESSPLADTPLARCVALAQEAATDGHRVLLALRPRIGEWLYIQGGVDDGYIDPVSTETYLMFKEGLVLGRGGSPWAPV